MNSPLTLVAEENGCKRRRASLLNGLIQFRAATEEDRPLLANVYASTRESEMARVAWSDDEKERFLAMQFNAQDTHYRAYYPGAEFWVILKEGLPAGRLYLCQTARELRIMDIALLPPFRSAGIGAAILTRLQLDAQAQGVFVSIHVEKENPARSLYTRLGFKETEDREVYLLMVWAPPQPTGGAEDRHLGGQPAAHLERKTT